MNLPPETINALAAGAAAIIAALATAVVRLMLAAAKTRRAPPEPKPITPTPVPLSLMIPDARASVPHPEREHTDPAISLTGKRVLLVDDHDDEAAWLARVVKGLNVEIVACTTAEEAIEWKRRHGIVLALIDVSLPGLQGDELVRMLRTRVYLYSGRTEEELAALVKASGADGFVQKTSDTEKLTRMVAKLLADT